MPANLTESIDKQKSMLIVGSAKTNYMLNQLTYFTTYESAAALYGESKLMRAYKTAKSHGATDIFLLNVKNNYDYLDISEAVKQGEFAYIVFSDLLLSDEFYDVRHANRKISYMQNLLNELGQQSNSTVIVSDKHASLYEDIDAFIQSMKTVAHNFKKAMKPGTLGQNIIFVANNLKEEEQANVVLASALSSCSLTQYPSGKFGAAIFDIDYLDLTDEIAYFKTNSQGMTTIENLLNFCYSGPQKIVTIDRIIKFVKFGIDFSEFKGSVFSDYQLLRIGKKLNSYLQSLKGFVLHDYKVTSITPYKDPLNKGTIVVVCRFDIWPINSVEKFSVEKGVEVG